jgi:nicotinamidase-related amidase
MVSDRFADAYVPDVVPESDLEYFDRGGHGARIGWGDSPAILVVDMTDEFTRERSAESERAVTETRDLLDVAREQEVPIVFTRPSPHLPADYRGTTKPKAPDAPEREGANEVDERLQRRPEEPLIDKPRASGFFDTHLAAMLHEWDVDTLVVTGLTTSGCVRASVVDAHSSNFDTIVPADCTADRSRISHEVSLFDMDMKYCDVDAAANVKRTLRRVTEG